jgi:hypothetical protein
MSTRCQILCNGHNAVIYRHSDGYPHEGKNGVLHTLLPLCKEFKRLRGWDPEYLTARIAHAMVDVILKDHNRMIKSIRKSDPGRDLQSYEQGKMLGVGVESFEGQFHGDLAYVYIVNTDHVEVRTSKNNKFWDNPILENMDSIERYDFDGKLFKLSSAKELVGV